MHDTAREIIHVDLAAFDETDRPALFAAIKARSGANPTTLDWARRAAAEFRLDGLSAPYWLVADLDRILILSHGDDGGLALEFDSPTAGVLSFYDPTFEQKRIFGDYLTTLISAWIHDLADRWKSPNPPGVQQLSEIGLVDKLRGGETRREVSLVEHDFVSRNQLPDEPFPGT